MENRRITTEKDYFLEIDQIKQVIENKEYSCALEQLNQLYPVKPVRLSWFVLKAYCEYQLGKKEDAISTLSEKYSYTLFYPGVDECAHIFSKIYENDKNLSLAHQFMELAIQGKSTLTFENQYQKAVRQAIDDLHQLHFAYEHARRNNDSLMASILEYFIYRDNSEEMARIRDSYQMFGYLFEKMEREGSIFILLCDGKNDAQIELLNRLLCEQHMVYIISDHPDMVVNEEENSDKLMKELFCNCNKEKKGTVRILSPIVNRTDITDLLIEHIHSEFSMGNTVMVLANGYYLNELEQRHTIQIHPMMPLINDALEENLKLAWAGDYYEYISDVYKYDVREDVCREPEVDFSIVIPARNSSYTLEHTLKTCLQQDYEGSYEIVVSDNSTDHNPEVYALIHRINDDRIRYYKTPRNLPLTKSYEYAYLKTRGKYILSIGSDDGLLPWALTTLHNVWMQYPQENILQWERGFYAWPGFNGGQQHELLIPKKVKAGQYGLHYVESLDYIARTIKFPENMYTLPNLYLNSAFARRYMNTLKERTGALWDGNNQDVSMGVRNVFLNQRILNMSYPITIAGMSSGSMGAITNSIDREMLKDEEVKHILGAGQNIVVYIPSAEERLLPSGMLGDRVSLYSNFLREINRGIIPSEYMGTVLDFKDMYLKIYEDASMIDERYERYLQNGRYSATRHGEEFLQWYEETIYRPNLRPHFIDEKRMNNVKKEQTYEEGPTKSGGLICNASKYGVQNIKDAVDLFVKLSEMDS